MADVFLSAGVRTPFVKAGGVYARRSTLELSIPVVQRMRAQTRPDLLAWGQVALVGSVESVSHVAIALKYPVAERVLGEFASNPASALESFKKLMPGDFDLPTKGWANRVSGRAMGEHMEDTAKEFGIAREGQDRCALLSHQSAIRGQDSGFFRDLIIPIAGIDHDTFPRRDTSLEKLGKLFLRTPLRRVICTV